MKSLTEYLLQERLKIDDKIYPKQDKVTVTIPKVERGDDRPNFDKEWKTFTFPNKKYVIYKDCYKGNFLHFANLGDMILRMLFVQGDYENFNPSKDIVYCSDKFDDAIDWYFKKLGLNMKELKQISTQISKDALEDEIDDNIGERTADSVRSFFVPIVLGEFNLDDYDEYGGDFDPYYFNEWLKTYI